MPPLEKDNVQKTLTVPEMMALTTAEIVKVSDYDIETGFN